MSPSITSNLIPNTLGFSGEQHAAVALGKRLSLIIQAYFGAIFTGNPQYLQGRYVGWLLEFEFIGLSRYINLGIATVLNKMVGCGS